MQSGVLSWRPQPACCMSNQMLPPSVECELAFGLPPLLKDFVAELRATSADMHQALDTDLLQEARKKHYVFPLDEGSQRGVWLHAIRMDELPPFPEPTTAGGIVDADVGDNASTASSEDDEFELDATACPSYISISLPPTHFHLMHHTPFHLIPPYPYPATRFPTSPLLSNVSQNCVSFRGSCLGEG